jgi:predicted transcriptional regulator
MDTIEIKTDLHSMIDQINDVRLLQAIRVLLLCKSGKTDWFDDLSKEEKELLEQGIKESDNGKVFSQNEILKEVKDRYPY